MVDMDHHQEDQSTSWDLFSWDLFKFFAIIVGGCLLWLAAGIWTLTGLWNALLGQLLCPINYYQAGLMIIGLALAGLMMLVSIFRPQQKKGKSHEE